MCEQFALTKIRNDRHLAVNSHEIRRRIAGLCERFSMINKKRYANRFVHITDFLINHPLCNGHYTTDIQWSILSFLLEIAYNPVGALQKNSNQIRFTDDVAADEIKPNDTTKQELIALLKADNLPLSDDDNDETSSDLSVRKLL